MARPPARRRLRRNLEHLGIWQLAITFDIEGGEVCNLDLEDYH